MVDLTLSTKFTFKYIVVLILKIPAIFVRWVTSTANNNNAKTKILTLSVAETA